MWCARPACWERPEESSREMPMASLNQPRVEQPGSWEIENMAPRMRRGLMEAGNRGTLLGPLLSPNLSGFIHSGLGRRPQGFLRQSTSQDREA